MVSSESHGPSSHLETQAPRSPLKIGRAPVFLKIWASIFLASQATFFVLMTLSATVFGNTGSAFEANAVVLTQWIPAVAALLLIRAAAARYASRELLVVCEAGSAVILICVAPLVTHVPLLFAVLLVKGGFDSLSKVARTLALKSYFSGAALSSAASYYNTAALIGGGAGALLGTVLLHRLPFIGVLALCVAMHLVAALIYASLPTTLKPTVATGAGAPASLSSVGVGPAIVYYVAAVSLFQGFHNIARSVYPVVQLGMQDAGIPLVQTVTNIAYIAGAFVAARIPATGGRYTVTGPLSHWFALLVLLPLPFMSTPLVGMSAYGLFAFGFELAFCVHLRQIIVALPSTQMARVVANTNAWAVGLMVLISLLGSFFVERVGLAPITVAIGGIAAIVPLALNARSGLRMRTAPVTHSGPGTQSHQGIRKG